MSRLYLHFYHTAECLVSDMKIDPYGFGAIQNWRSLQQLLTSVSKKICRVLVTDLPYIIFIVLDAISLEGFTRNIDIWLTATVLFNEINNSHSVAFLKHIQVSNLACQFDAINRTIVSSLEDEFTSESSKMFDFSESLLMCLLCSVRLATAFDTPIDSDLLTNRPQLNVYPCKLQTGLLLKLYYTVCFAPQYAHATETKLPLLHRSVNDNKNDTQSSVTILPTRTRDIILHLLYLHVTLHRIVSQIEHRDTHTSQIPLYSVLYYLHHCVVSLHAYQHDASILEVAVSNVDVSAVHSILTAFPLLIHYINDEGHTWLHRCCIQDYNYYTHYHSVQRHSSERRDSSVSSIDSPEASVDPQFVSPSTISSHTRAHILSQEEYVQCSEALLEVLLKFNFNVNAPDCTGRTALHSCSSARTVELLCTAGADPNASDNAGITPLHQCVLSDRVECVRVLLEKGADPTVRESMKGRSSIHYAAMLGMYDALYTLLRYSLHIVEIEARDHSGNTALHLCAACQAADPSKCILLLLNQGAAVKVTTHTGITALHLVCCNALLNAPQNTTSEPLVEMLLQRGASPNAPDADGCTPLIVACAYREFALCKLLLLYGGDLNIPCSMQSTFLSVGFVDHCVDIHSTDGSANNNNSGDNSCKESNNYANNFSSHTDCEDINSVHSGNTNPNTPSRTTANYFASAAYYTTSFVDNNNNTNNNTSSTQIDTITATDLLPKKPRYTVFSSINALQSRIPCANRDRCMNCGDYFNGSEATVYHNSTYNSVYPGSTTNHTNNTGSVNKSGVISIGSMSSVYNNFANIINEKFRSGRHHCRLCRRVVCMQCSGHMLGGAAVPLFVREQYTHEKEHRMCDVCYDVLCDKVSEVEGGGGVSITDCSERGSGNTSNTSTVAEGSTSGVASNKGYLAPLRGLGFLGF